MKNSKTIPCTIIALSFLSAHASADCLKRSSDFASDICGSITTQGSRERFKASGNIGAEVGGAIRKFLGSVDGHANIVAHEENYRNVIRNHLAAELANVRDCRREMVRLAREEVCTSSTSPVKKRATTESKEKLKQTLRKAVDSRDHKLVEEMLNQGASPNSTIDANYHLEERRWRFRVPLLTKAVTNGDLESAELLLRYGADADATEKILSASTAGWTTPTTPLMFLITFGPTSFERKMVQKLAEKANLNSVDSRGHTALMLAIDRDRLGIAEELIKLGADVLVSNDSYDALMMAISKGHLEMVDIILKQDHRVVRTQVATGTALIHAVINGYDQLLPKLRRSDVNATTSDGITALSIAVATGELELTTSLLKMGANINLENTTGWMPLHIAAASGRLDLVKLLVKRGADLESKTNEGHTPMVVAFRGAVGKDKKKGDRYMEVVNALRCAGAQREPLKEYYQRLSLRDDLVGFKESTHDC